MSQTGIIGQVALRLSCRNSTSRRQSCVMLHFPWSGRKYFLRSVAGRPRLVSRLENSPSRAWARIGSEMSVARIRTRQVATRSAKCSLSSMAML